MNGVETIHPDCPVKGAIDGRFDQRYESPTGEAPFEQSLGKVTVCGSYEYWSRRHGKWRTKQLDQPCTGNARETSWLSKPYRKDKVLIVCGRENYYDGQRGIIKYHKKCPSGKYFTGKFDVVPVDDVFDRVTRTLCEGYEFWSGSHTSNVTLDQVFYILI
jgi:hypothetical protein